MGKNDLLSEDDFFTDKSEQKHDISQPEPLSIRDEDDLFKDIEFDKNDEITEKPKPLNINSSRQEPEFIIDGEEEKPMEKSPAKESTIPESGKDIPAKEKEPVKKIQYDYEEEAQDKVNYKPIIIIIIILILATIAYFAYKYLIEEKEPEAVEQVAPGPSPEEIARAEFYSGLNGKTRFQLNHTGNILSLTSDKNRLSSLMIYGDDFVMEIYSNTRAELARYIKGLKTQYSSEQFSLEATTDRPGKSGGVFGQFALDLDKNGSDKTEVPTPFANSDEIKSWINRLATDNGIQVTDLKTSSIAPKDIYQGIQLETTLSGSIDAFKQFLSNVRQSNKNMLIHKLSLISTDLKSYRPGKYQLKFISKIYI
ncbi:MAG: hypothetical protein JXR46_15405 [Calditrichaceae bacterium]|nr:hypothetical protein [Calditrichaceae bacterium]MBN2710430.1 hypothetical protein [Calditrichaceae bacterium]